MSVQEVIESGSNKSVAETVFKVLSSRARSRAVTDLRRLYTDVIRETQGNVPQEAFNEVIKDMEKAGLGRFVAGRGNKPDRFKWTDQVTAKSVKEGNTDKKEAAKPLAPSSKPVTKIRRAKKNTKEMAPASYLNIQIPLHGVTMEALQSFFTSVQAKIQPA
jgi:hypothetical protein